MNPIDSVARSQDLLLAVLQNASAKPQELAEKLVALNAQQTLDANKLEGTGKIVDLCV